MFPRLGQRIGREEGGFTLIELVVVLITIGVLLTIAVPTYLGFKDNAQQKAAASDVRSAVLAAEAFFSDNKTYSGMEIAPLRAIDGGLSTDIVTVKPSVDGATYCISAQVGRWFAHVNGPAGSIVPEETTDGCQAI